MKISFEVNERTKGWSKLLKRGKIKVSLSFINRQSFFKFFYLHIRSREQGNPGFPDFSILQSFQNFWWKIRNTSARTVSDVINISVWNAWTDGSKTFSKTDPVPGIVNVLKAITNTGINNTKSAIILAPPLITPWLQSVVGEGREKNWTETILL